MANQWSLGSAGSNLALYSFNNAPLVGTTPINPTSWYHVSIANENNCVNVYLNGQLEISASTSNMIDTSGSPQPLYIGSLNSNTYQSFTGYIDELLLTNNNTKYISNYTTPSITYNAAYQPNDIPSSATILLLHLDNNYIDSSYYQNIISSAGTPTFSTSINVFGGYSMTLNGTSQYIYIGTPAAPNTFTFGSLDFTMEAWIYITSTSAANCIFSNYPASTIPLIGGTVNWWYLQVNATTPVLYFRTYNSNITLTGITSLSTSTWYHVALTRNGQVISIYLNGKLEASTTALGTSVLDKLNSTNQFGIGAYSTLPSPTSTTTYFTGNIDEVRITKGYSRYSTTFTPPVTTFATAPLYDITPSQNINTVLLLHFDTPTFTDSSYYNNVATNVGSTITTNTQYKFGNTSLYLSGSLQYIYYPSSSLFSFGYSDFTIECWLYSSNVTSMLRFLGNLSNGVAFTTNNWAIGIDSTSSSKIVVYVYNQSAGSPTMTGTIPLSTNTWYHYALVRYGGVFTQYINGVKDVSLSNSTLSFDGGAAMPFCVGGSGKNSSGENFTGYIDEVRVTKGTAMYLTNFTPQNAPFGSTLSAVQQNSSVILLMHNEGANGSMNFIDSSPYNNPLTAYNFAQISTANDAYGASCLYLPATLGSVSNAGTAYVQTNSSLQNNLGTGDFTIEFWFNWSGTYSTSSSSNQRLMSNTTASWAANYWVIGFDNNSSNYSAHLGFAAYNIYNVNGNVWYASTVVIQANTWYHFAVTRQGTNFYVFSNGILQNTYTGITTAVDDGATARVINIGGNPGDSQYFYGYMDEVRITKGFARYTASFQLPQRQYSTYTSPIPQQVATSTAGNTANTCPLDGLSPVALQSAKGLYSVVRLLTAYTGAIVNVRRSTDGVTLDFYADQNGNLETYINGTGLSLTAWLAAGAVGSGSIAIGYVVKWYDQSGNGNHATQSINAGQPIINPYNKYIDFKTQSSSYLNLPSGTIPQQKYYSVILRHNTSGNANTSIGSLLGGGASGTPANQGNYFYTNPNGVYTNSWNSNNMNSVAQYVAGSVCSWVFGSQGSLSTTIPNTTASVTSGYTSFYVNGSLASLPTNRTGWSGPLAGGNETIGANMPTSNPGFNGELYFVTIFAAALSDADRSLAENIYSGTVTNLVACYDLTNSLSYSGNASPCVLDGLSQGAIASARCLFAVVRLLSSWTGPTVNIYRTSDASYTDFYADASGNLGTSPNATGVSIIKWLANTTGYVAVWYDQSGSGRHATQPTTTVMAQIDPYNLLVDFRANTNTAYMLLPNGTIPPNNVPSTISFKLGIIVGSNERGVWLGGNQQNGGVNAGGINASGQYFNSFWSQGGVTLTSTGIPGAACTFINTLNSSTQTTNPYLNGASASIAANNNGAGNASFVATPSGSYDMLGSTRNNTNGVTPLGGNPLSAQLYYFAAFTVALSTDDRNIVENIGSFPAASTTVNDLSGSGPGNMIVFKNAPAMSYGQTGQGINTSISSKSAGITNTPQVIDIISKGFTVESLYLNASTQAQTNSISAIFGDQTPMEYPPTSLNALVAGTANPQISYVSGAAYGNGQYTVTASSASTGSYSPNLAFDKAINAYGWQSSASVYNSVGAALGAYGTTTYSTYVGGLPPQPLSTGANTLTGQIYYGEWLQIQMPNFIYATSYSLTVPTANISYFPYSWVLVGSNDANMWSLIDSRNSQIVNATITGQVMSYNIQYPGTYAYYRIIVTYVQTTTASATAVPVQIGEMRIFGYSLNQQYEYPPSSLATGVTSVTNGINAQSTTTIYGNAYGNGTYVVKASSDSGASGQFNAYYAFDKVFNNSTNGLTFNSYNSNTAYAYDSTSGAYNTSNGTAGTKTISGTVYNGEWLQIQLPAPIILSSYTLSGRNDQAKPMTPYSWVIAGSNDGSNWILLSTVTAQVFIATTTQGQTLPFIMPPTTAAYQYYVILVTALPASNLNGQMAITEWRLYSNYMITTQTNTPTVQPLEYPPASVTNFTQTGSGTSASPYSYTFSGQSYGNGTYTVAASSFYTGQNPYFAFDKIIGTTGATQWGVNNTFYTGSNNTTWSGGTNYPTTLNGATTYGEWLQLGLPYQIILTGYTISASLYFGKTPATWIIAGSNDGTNFYTVSNGGYAWTADMQTQSFGCYTTTAYSYYRMIILTLIGSAINTYDANGGAELAEWRLFGTQITSNYKLPPKVPASSIFQYPPISLGTATQTGGSGTLANGLYPTLPIFTMYVSGQTYGNGTYIISASTQYNTNASESLPYVFDRNTATWWTESVNNYTVTTGVYAGSVTTNVQGTNYSGEWIQIQLPNQIILSSYYITTRAGFLTRGAGIFYVLGSNDGTNWYIVDSRSGISGWTTLGFTFSTTSTTAYSYFRLVINTTTGDGYLSVGEWQLFTTYSQTVTQLQNPQWTLLEYPPVTLASPYLETGTSSSTSSIYGQPYGNGQYYVTASDSPYQTNYPYLVFDKLGTTLWANLTSVYTGNSNTTWSAGTTNSSMTLDGTLIYRLWLQIQLPTPIYLAGYFLSGCNFSQAVNYFIIAGSNDGTNFFTITVNNYTPIVNSQSQYFTALATKAYSYFRIIPLTLQGGSGSNGATGFLEWKLYAPANPLTYTSLLQQQQTNVQIYSYPPLSLAISVTASGNAGITNVNGQLYGNGTYITNCSTFYSGNQSYYAFDNNTTTFWSGNIARYNTASPYTYNGTGISSITISGTAYTGEWLSVQLPSPIVLTSMSMTTRTDNTSLYYQTPAQWVLGGSNDGVNWTLIYYQSTYLGFTSSGQTISYNTPSPSNNPYAYYIIVVLAYSGASTGSPSGYVSIGEWMLNGYPQNQSVVTPTPAQINTLTAGPVAEYPPGTGLTTGTLTSGTAQVNPAYTTVISSQPYGNGAYVTSASSTDISNGTDAPYFAFNKITGVAQASQIWNANGPYYSTTSPYQYTGTAYTLINGITYNGEWLQIQLPYPIVLVSYSIQARSDSYATSQSPGTWYIVGCNDGINWVTVDYQANIASWTTSSIQTYTISNAIALTPTVAYSYYRIVILNVMNSTVASGPYPAVGEWRLYGYTSSSSSVNTIPVNTWTHGVLTVSNTGVWSWYKNATLAASGSGFNIPANIARYLAIGDYAGINTIIGNIALSRLYNRVLTTAQITQNYAAIAKNYGIPTKILDLTANTAFTLGAAVNANAATAIPSTPSTPGALPASIVVSPSVPTIPNASFELPYITPATFTQSAAAGTVTGWTTSAYAGLNTSGSGFGTVGTIPDGRQYLLLQAGYSGATATTASTTITGLTIGTSYTISMYLSLRPSFSTPGFSVQVGNVTVLSFLLLTGSPLSTGAGFVQYTTNPFTAIATTATLTLSATASGSDSTVYVDNLTIAVAYIPTSIATINTPTIQNPSFELFEPNTIGTAPNNYAFLSVPAGDSSPYCCNLPGWTLISGNVFVGGNGNPFSPPTIPDGNMCLAFHYYSSSTNPSVSTVMYGLTPGQQYTISLYVAYRTQYSLLSSNLILTVDGNQILNIPVVTYTTFTRVTSNSFWATAPTAVLMIATNKPISGTDSTIFIDLVTITPSTSQNNLIGFAGTGATSAAGTITTPVPTIANNSFELAQSCDYYYNNVMLLLHFDGANGGTSFTDFSKNATAMNVYSVTTSSTQYVFGTTSLYMNGNSSLYTPTSSAYLFGSNNFTIECWIYPTSVNAGGSCFLTNFAGAWTTDRWAFGLSGSNYNAGGYYLYFAVNNLGQNTGTLGQVVMANVYTALNKWYHVAIVRNGNSFTLYQNGVMVGTQSYTYYNGSILNLSLDNSTTATTSFINIGGEITSGTGSYNFYGYLDDLRITNGVVRYTANFTPPTFPFPNIGPYASITNGLTSVDPYASYVVCHFKFDEYAGLTNLLGLADQSGNRTIARMYNCQILAPGSTGAPATSAFTGSGNILGPTVAGGLAATASAMNAHYYLQTDTGLIFGTSDFTIEFWFYYVGTTSTGADNRMFSNWNGGTFQSNHFAITGPGASSGGNVALWVYNISNAANVFALSSAPAANQWNHFALSRYATNGKLYMYLNGTVNTNTYTISSGTSFDNGVPHPLVIGAYPGDPAYCNCFFDELRVTIGVDRYKGANFTPPSPVPNVFVNIPATTLTPIPNWATANNVGIISNITPYAAICPMPNYGINSLFLHQPSIGTVATAPTALTTIYGLIPGQAYVVYMYVCTRQYSVAAANLKVYVNNANVYFATGINYATWTRITTSPWTAAASTATLTILNDYTGYESMCLVDAIFITSYSSSIPINSLAFTNNPLAIPMLPPEPNVFLLGGNPTINTYATGGIRYGSVLINGQYYYVHSFTTTGTSYFTIIGGSLTCDILVVAGGGGGGEGTGGGGGAGGVQYFSAQLLPATTYQITVGAGGTGGKTSGTVSATNGGNSQFGTLNASVGGGAGQNPNATGSGGSGGGSYASTPGAGTTGQGYAGGSGVGYGNYESGGGGGAGGPGTTGVIGTPGVGGPGVVSTITGTAVYYGGGGGGAWNGSPYGGLGGIGGGGNGGNFPTSGAPNSGGGGGGDNNYTGTSGNGAAGGSGIVIVRYPISYSPVVYPLDTVSGSAMTYANGLFSVKRLLTSYTGPVMNLRNSGTSATQDFYADPSQNLWTQPNGTGQTFAAWIGANTAYVTIWYDQSGKGNNATQTTTTLQPVYNAATKLLDFSIQTNANFNLPNGTVPYNDMSFTMTIKHGTVSNNSFPTFIFSGSGGGTANYNCLCYDSHASQRYFQYWSNSDLATNTTVSATPGNIVTGTYKTGNGSRNIYINTVLQSTLYSAGSATTRASPSTNNFIGGANYVVNNLNGQLYYAAIFSTVLSNADRLVVEAQ